MNKRFLLSESQLKTLTTYYRRGEFKRAKILIDSVIKHQFIFESESILYDDIERAREHAGKLKGGPSTPSQANPKEKEE